MELGAYTQMNSSELQEWVGNLYNYSSQFIETHDDANTAFLISTHAILTDSKRCPSRSFFRFLYCTKKQNYVLMQKKQTRKEKAATTLPQR